MEQVEALSNLFSDPGQRGEIETLHGILTAQPGTLSLDQSECDCPARIPQQTQHRLDADEQAGLVEAYLSGDTVGNLASTYQLHRGTVSEILSRHGVTRPAPVGLAQERGPVRTYFATILAFHMWRSIGPPTLSGQCPRGPPVASASNGNSDN